MRVGLTVAWISGKDAGAGKCRTQAAIMLIGDGLSSTGPMARILVVEDDSAIRQLIVDVLIDDGHDTEQANDGLAALDQVRRFAPDAVVLDLFMPRMDGEEFLNLCRMIPACAHIPFVILSASDRMPVDKRIRAFLKKPFDLSVLSGAVRSILAAGMSPRPA